MNIVNIKMKVKNKMFKSVSYVLSANFISQIESFIFVIMVTKVLSVEQYGIYTVVMMLINMVTDLSDMGMNSAVTRFSAQYYSSNEIDKEKELVLIAFKRKLINSLIVVGFIIISSKSISLYFLKTSSYKIFFIISAIGILFSLINGLNISVLQGRQQYKKYSISVVTTNLLTLIILVILFLINKISIASLLIVNVVSIVFSCIVSYIFVGYKVNLIFKISKISDSVKSNFSSFGRWMLIWSVFSILQSRIDTFMLAKLTTVTEVSYYDIAMKMSKPILMVVSSYSQVLNPMMATLNGKSEIKKKLNDIVKFIMFLSAIIIVAIMTSKFLIRLFFSNKYDSSILPFQIILFSLIFYIWTAPYNSALYALNKPQIFCFASFLGLITTILGNFILLNRYGAVGASITFLFAQIVALVVSYSYYRKLVRNE